MDENLHLNKQMDEVESLHGRRREDSLLGVLTETVRGLEAVRRRGDHQDGTMGGRRCTAGGGEKAGRGGGEEIQRGSEGGGMPSSEAGEEEDEEGGNADEEREERERRQKVLGVLRELSGFHSDRVTAWREVLRDCARMLYKSPPGGSDQQHPSTTDM